MSRADPKSSDAFLSSPVEGASLLIALQIGSRALTFIVNQSLLRYLSPERFAIANQLEVYSLTVLFFSRESLRVALQRQSQPVEEPSPSVAHSKISSPSSKKDHEDHLLDARSEAGKTQIVVNLAYVSLLLAFFLAPALAWLYRRSLSAGAPVVLVTPYFNETLLIYCGASILELLAEPGFAVVQRQSRYRVRAAAEAIATLVRCLTTCFVTIYATRMKHDIGLLPLALGQCAYALMLPAIYCQSVRPIAVEKGFSLLPRKLHSRYGSMQ